MNKYGPSPGTLFQSVANLISQTSKLEMTHQAVSGTFKILLGASNCSSIFLAAHPTVIVDKLMLYKSKPTLNTRSHPPKNNKSF